MVISSSSDSEASSSAFGVQTPQRRGIGGLVKRQRNSLTCLDGFPRGGGQEEVVALSRARSTQLRSKNETPPALSTANIQQPLPPNTLPSASQLLFIRFRNLGFKATCAYSMIGIFTGISYRPKTQSVYSASFVLVTCDHFSFALISQNKSMNSHAASTEDLFHLPELWQQQNSHHQFPHRNSPLCQRSDSTYAWQDEGSGGMTSHFPLPAYHLSDTEMPSQLPLSTSHHHLPAPPHPRRVTNRLKRRRRAFGERFYTFDSRYLPPQSTSTLQPQQ
ncbi:unnamed protein product [Rodentolepis nana]|uniref:Uncharacterized protein n=1 Tax=Rodentolepis nana TaxID=102285 RepID=A0A0R3T1R5_RODNA|nr:unnamed protein product [Rodentolepis nana]